MAATGDTAVHRGRGSSVVEGHRALARPLEVLVVEDNIVNQRVVGLMLQQLGHADDPLRVEHPLGVLLVVENHGLADGPEVVVECTGSPHVWADALDAVRVGGLVNLFGGCAPGTRVPLDTHRLHYSEITVKGVYHHRPQTVRRALGLLARGDFEAERLLSARRPIEEVEAALRSMIARETLKVVLEPRRG